MSYTNKKNLEEIEQELGIRYQELCTTLDARPPKDAFDGAGRGKWNTPENVRIFTKSAMERRLAVEGFKAILNEIKKIK